VVLSSDSDIGLDLLPDHIVGRGASVPTLDASAGTTLFGIMEDCERRIIIDMLEKCGSEPDRSGGTLPRPALPLSEKKNQTAGHRDQEEEPGVVFFRSAIVSLRQKSSRQTWRFDSTDFAIEVAKTLRWPVQEYTLLSANRLRISSPSPVHQATCCSRRT